jgi:hypothetical protein
MSNLSAREEYLKLRQKIRQQMLKGEKPHLSKKGSSKFKKTMESNRLIIKKLLPPAATDDKK